jgi:predicted NAD/FAD-binding protein
VPRSLTRREVLKGGVAAVGAGVVGGAVPGAAAAARRPRERVAIVGAGAGGIAAAYFLAGSCDVEIFESRSRIGGHCDSRRVAYEGHEVTVDLGAQFFGPDTHPLYVTLLEQLGLDRQTHAATGSLCVFPIAGGGAPRFTSTHPLDTLPAALQFASFTQLARQAVTGGLAWETTVAQWIAGLPLDQAFKDDILTPWITATIGCSHAEAQRVSARSILQTFALAFPADPAAGAKTYNSKIGLQGNLQNMLDRVPVARVHRNAPVRALTRTKAGWMVRTPAGRSGPFKHIIMNAPPRIGRALLRPLPAFAAVTALLSTYTYFDSRLLIHSDPVYMYRNRTDWTAYNAGADGRECEGSAWIGALHDPLPGGAPVDLFKSWAQRRRADPKHIILERRFQHPLIDPHMIAAARALRAHQGRGGLWFSGAYTTGADLQETALYSAMKVAEQVAPASGNLTALRARARAKGLARLSYDL